jgi:hypothetical protein
MPGDEELPSKARLTPGSNGPTLEEFLATLPAPSTDAQRYDRQRILERDRERMKQAATREGRMAMVAASNRPRPPFRLKRLKRYQALYERAAQILAQRGEAALQTNGYGPMRFQLHRFPDGSEFFEYEYAGSSGGQSRDPHDADSLDIARLIFDAFWNAHVRPIAGQEI